jgi:hypothetical protein
MSSIGGKVRENNENEYVKKVGLFEGEVIAINPTLEQFKSQLGIELAEESKQADYLGTKDGKTTLRVDVWFKNVKDENVKVKASFFLEDKIRQNKDETKQQYINEIGMCAWASDPNDLPDWFSKREYREAYVGEEDLYNLMRIWLGKLDFRDASTILQLEWKKLMKGNVKDLKDQIDGEYSSNVGVLATVITKETDDGVKQYQGVYSKAFLPAYALKNFRLVDYSNNTTLEQVRAKQSKDLKPHERFVLNVTGEYGCKHYYNFKELVDYDIEDDVTSSDETMISDDNGDY